MTEFGAVEFRTQKSFYGKLWDAEPDPTNPAKPLRATNAKHYDESEVLGKFVEWLENWNERVVFVSDNNGYDSQWINFYFDKNNLENPFGHSSRRISDFYAGLTNNWTNTQGWKRYRVTPHTHNPVDDAMGNVEAVKTLLNKYNFGGLRDI